MFVPNDKDMYNCLENERNCEYGICGECIITHREYRYYEKNKNESEEMQEDV